MFRVLNICDQNGVSEFYRTLTPYRLLHEAGYIELKSNDGLNPAVMDHLDQFEAIVFSRADTPAHSLILREAKTRGLRVVFDIDDNLFLLPPSIPAYSAWHERGSGKITARTWYLKRNIGLADVLTVSTRRLGEQLCNGEPHSFRGRNDFIVLPNQVLAAEWDIPPAEKPAGEVWVTWWGIYNHWDDWRDVAPFIEPVIARRPEVKLVILGMPEIAHLFPVLRKQDQLIVGPFVASEDLAPYRAILKASDIALAPTSPCPFNESKSDLKILQYGAAGLPVIASSVTYRGWEDLAFIMGRPVAWGAMLESALGNLPRAKEMGRALQQAVMEHRTYEGNFRRWLEALGIPELPPQRVAPAQIEEVAV